jgi:hypothetical protein
MMPVPVMIMVRDTFRDHPPVVGRPGRIRCSTFGICTKFARTDGTNCPEVPEMNDCSRIRVIGPRLMWGSRSHTKMRRPNG